MKQIDEFWRMLDEKLIVADEDGVVLQVALMATIYVTDMHRREVREALVACCEQYFQRCGSHLRWALRPDTGKMVHFEEGEASRLRQWLPALDEHDSTSLSYHSAEWHLGAGAYTLRALVCAKALYRALGYVRFTVPVQTLSNEPDLVPSMLLDFSRRLRPMSGYGGIGMVATPDYGLAEHYNPVVYGVAQRFPGMEVDYPVWHGISLGKEEGWIKGVNWLTVVDDPLLKRLGGVDSVRSDLAALDSGFDVFRFDGGLMIRAGTRPELGDAAAGNWPALYVKLAKYLKPLRVVSHPPFHRTWEGVDVFTEERTQAWLSRFEDR